MSDGVKLIGDLFVVELDTNGTQVGGERVNPVTLIINPGEVESDDRISYMRDTEGQALNSTSTSSPATLSVSTDDGGPEVFAMVAKGLVSAISQNTGSLTDEEVSVPTLDKWYFLTKAPLDEDSEEITGTGGTPTYVKDTDYTMDYVSGAFLPLSTGSITAGLDLEVDVDYAAKTGKRVAGGAGSEKRYKVLMDGTNKANGKAMRFEAYQVALSADGELDLRTSTYVVNALSGTMETPTGGSEPYILDYLD